MTESAKRAWSRVDTAAVACLVVLGGFVRLAGLNRPTGLVFDEIFYARDACWYVIGTEAACGITDLASRAHPPLGKWIIGAGIATFGYEPFGWRVAAAVAGTLGVALTYVLARRLLTPVAREPAAVVGAIVAGGLLATDFLHVVNSRVAMLDVFIALFVVGALLAIVLDRDRARDRPGRAATWLERATLGRPWRLVAGVCLGAAAATKWSGAYVGLALVALVLAWELAAERRRDAGAGWRTVLDRAARRELVPSIVLLGLVPLAAYLVSYAGRMPGPVLALPWAPGSVWQNILEHQRAMLDFHTGLGGHHPYESPPWSWPLLKRPVAYFFTDADGSYRHILALGNPLVWWPGFLAVLGLAVAWARRRGAAAAPETLIVAAALATYLPWLVLSGSRTQVFLWYLLPTVPFLCLALGLVAARLWERLAGRVVMAACGVVIVASFAFYLPILTALPVAPDAWWLRIPFRDCERRDAPTLTLPDDQISEGRPPDGWCWI